jgi:hypothetical protein
MQEEDFDLAEEPSGGDSFPGFKNDSGNIIPDKKHPENCQCGCHKKQRSKFKKLFHKFAMLFASKEEKAKARATALMGEFTEKQLEAGQKEIDKTIESFVDALGMVDTYDDAPYAIAEAIKKHDGADFAHRIEEIRYVAQVLGEHNG